MYTRLVFFVILLFPATILSYGQCPVRDSLNAQMAAGLRVPAGTATAQLQRHVAGLLRSDSLMNTCAYRGDSTQAKLRQCIAVLYFRMQQYNLAMSWVKMSNKLIAAGRIRHAGDPTLLLVNYNILSSCCENLNLPEEKVAFLDSCVTTFSTFANRINIDAFIGYPLQALKKKAQALFDIGDYQLCFKTADRGERLNQRYYDGKPNGLVYRVSFLTFKVNTLLATKEYSRAEALLLQEADDLKRNGSDESFGTVYDLLGQIQVSKGNPQEARRFFMLSLKYGERSKSMISCMETYTNLGYHVYDKSFHDFPPAMACYRRALECFYAGPTRDKAASMEALNLLANMANLFVQKKAYDSAFHYFTLALDQIQPGLDEKGLLTMSFDKISKTEYLTGLLLDKADACFQLYREKKRPEDFEKAISLYRTTDNVLDKLRTEQSDIQSKLFWRKDNHRLYEHAIEACFLAGNKMEVAFYFFEKSRAVLLNDQLTEQMFLDDKDFYQQAFYVRKIAGLQKELSLSDINASNYDGLENKLLEYKQLLELLQKKHKAQNAGAYRKLFDSAGVTVSNVQKKLLKDHHALIELFEGDQSVYEIIITRNEIRLDKINKQQFDSTLSAYLTYISDASLLNRNLDIFHHTARQLYDLMFRDKWIPKGRIIISPDGQYFPFEALVTGDPKKTVYFLEDHAVSYTYSARYLLISNTVVRKPAAGTKTLLGMAPVEYPYDSMLSNLNGSAGSIRNVKNWITDADDFLDGDATKSNFQHNFYKYKINYLSTHASDSGSTGEPVIYFADGPMSLSELVAETKPETELIIASACKTGVGKVYRGEGVYNFSRGFASVGIPACVNNLWSVDAASANELIELFCKYIVAGEPTDVALQKAKLEFLRTNKDNQLPYFWAASILSGRTGIITCKQSTPWKARLIASLAGILVIGGGWVVWKRRAA